MRQLRARPSSARTRRQSQYVLRDVLFLQQAAELVLDEGLVNPDLPRLFIGRLKRDVLQQLLHHRVQPSGADVLEAGVGPPGRIGQRDDGLVVELQGDPLGRAGLIVATDLDGAPREAKVRQGIALPEASLRRLFGAGIGWQEVAEWSRREARVIARRQERFGALVLDDRPWPDAPAEALARAALDGLRQIGLTWNEPARRLRARIALLRAEGAEMPDVSDEGLLATAGDWLLPHLSGRRSEADLRALDLADPLRRMLTWEQGEMLDRLAPAQFTTPLGRQVPIDYEGDHPSISLRLQELFGVTLHPVVGPRRLPLRITLLSPANRPVQVTLDLPGFWATSYADVRKDMRGQYPRHPWPEDPTAHAPTLRAKPRGT